jgi:hypothetical protein
VPWSSTDPRRRAQSPVWLLSTRPASDMDPRAEGRGRQDHRPSGSRCGVAFDPMAFLAGGIGGIRMLPKAPATGAHLNAAAPRKIRRFSTETPFSSDARTQTDRDDHQAGARQPRRATGPPVPWVRLMSARRADVHAAGHSRRVDGITTKLARAWPVNCPPARNSSAVFSSSIWVVFATRRRIQGLGPRPTPPPASPESFQGPAGILAAEQGTWFDTCSGRAAN